MITSPGSGATAVEQVVALDDADARTGEVERPGLHQPGMLGRLAADEGAAGLDGSRPPRRPDQRRDGVRVEAARPRRSRGRPAARPRCRRRRRRTSPRGRCRSCPSGRAPSRSRSSSRRRRSRRRSAARGSRPGSRSRRRTRRARRRPPAGGSTRRPRASARPPGRPPRRRRRRAYVGRPRAQSVPQLSQPPASTGSSSMNLRLAASYGTGSG